MWRSSPWLRTTPRWWPRSRRTAGALSRATRWQLAKKAFASTAAYDTAIANTLETLTNPQLPGNDPHTPANFSGAEFPAALRVNYPLANTLRYGENPHQNAALYTDGSGTGIAGGKQLQGKELSFNNLVDLDACWNLVQEFPASEAAVAIIKHTNPCGAATGSTVLEAYTQALAADPMSAYGGVIGINREVDGAAAEEIAKLFVEAIVAPSFTPDALARFAAKKNLRLVEIISAKPARAMKQVSGGMLLQDADTRGITAAELTVATTRKPTAEELAALLFAWRVCKHVKSNAIVYAKAIGLHGQTIGIGAGQMSRVDAARFGAMKAVLPLAGCVAASDAFFPFADGLEVRRPGRRDRRHPARRLRPRRRGHRSRQQAGDCDGLHRHPPFPPRLIHSRHPDPEQREGEGSQYLSLLALDQPHLPRMERHVTGAREQHRQPVAQRLLRKVLFRDSVMPLQPIRRR